MVSFVANELYKRHKDLLETVNPSPIKELKHPFKRMSYIDAL